MRKIIFILFLFISFVGKAQVYQEMPQYGYRANRMIFDSTLSIPTTCGVPTLKSNITNKAAIAFDSCNNKFYKYNPKTLIWSEISGSSLDTTSLSNRINSKADTSSVNLKLNISDTANKWVNSIIRTLGKDSIIYFIGSNRYAIKDSVGTNPAPVGYYGAFQDNTSQTAASINTAYPVKLNTTDLTNGVTVVNDGSSNPTRITLANTGIYNIQFSLQLEKTGGSGNMIADIWVRKNGVDIPSTTGKVVLTGSANASPVVAAWNYVLNLVAGDYVQLMWSTSNTNVEIVAAAAAAPYPSIPSAILTVTQQSGIMAGTGITAINSLTGAAQTLGTGTSGTDFAISSSGTSHTFNLPTASATNRGALSSTDWSTFNGKLNTSDSTIYYTKFRSDTSRTNIYSALNAKVKYSDTVSLSDRINLKVNIADTSTMLSKYLRKIDTASLSTRIDARVKYSDTASMLSTYQTQLNTKTSDWYVTLGQQAMGSTIKSICLIAPTMGMANTIIGMTSQQVRFVAVYLPQAATLTGVKWIQQTNGSYTANNYNGVGLYTYSGGTLTLVASSTNDGACWSQGGSAMNSKAFSSTYSASAGLYFIGAMYSSSAQTTAPSLIGVPTLINAAMSMDLTNSAKLSGQISTQTALPTPQAMSGVLLNGNGFAFWLY
jgi:hypothetical protein